MCAVQNCYNQYLDYVLFSKIAGVPKKVFPFEHFKKNNYSLESLAKRLTWIHIIFSDLLAVKTPPKYEFSKNLMLEKNF